MSSPGSIYGRPWSEAEYIVSLDAYFKNHGKPVHQQAPHVQRLSRITGRTPDSIAMRLENFASMDPRQAHRKGLPKIGPAGERVIREWFEQPQALSMCAGVLRRQMGEGGPESLFSHTQPTRIFDKYVLEDQWREGGFARIFTCRRESDGKLLALKGFRPERLSTAAPGTIERFRREIRLLRSLRHARVMCVYEDSLESEPHEPAYVMDLAEYSLSEYVAQRAMTGPDEPPKRPCLAPTEAARIFQAVCEAVAALHANTPRIIHRDINPNNILLVDDKGWVLGDFGLAKYLGTPPAITTFATMTGPGIGTGHYTAPEQWKNMRAADVSADIYSLGVLLWELHTATTAFLRDCLDVPSWIEPVVKRALAVDPSERFVDVPSMLAALDHARSEPSCD